MNWREGLLAPYAASFLCAVLAGAVALGAPKEGRRWARLWPAALIVWAGQAVWAIRHTFWAIDLAPGARASEFVLVNGFWASIAGIIVLAIAFGSAALSGRVASWPRAAAIVVIAWALVAGVWAWYLRGAFLWEARMNGTRLANNGMHQTGRGGVALRSPRPVVEARPAGDAGCCAGR